MGEHEDERSLGQIAFEGWWSSDTRWGKGWRPNWTLLTDDEAGAWEAAAQRVKERVATDALYKLATLRVLLRALQENLLAEGEHRIAEELRQLLEPRPQ